MNHDVVITTNWSVGVEFRSSWWRCGRFCCIIFFHLAMNLRDNCCWLVLVFCASNQLIDAFPMQTARSEGRQQVQKAQREISMKSHPEVVPDIESGDEYSSDYSVRYNTREWFMKNSGLSGNPNSWQETRHSFLKSLFERKKAKRNPISISNSGQNSIEMSARFGENREAISVGPRCRQRSHNRERQASISEKKSIAPEKFLGIFRKPTTIDQKRLSKWPQTADIETGFVDDGFHHANDETIDYYYDDILNVRHSRGPFGSFISVASNDD